jgi:hypothetical protein
MPLSHRTTMVAGGLVWGGAIPLVSPVPTRARLITDRAFLHMMSSACTWFHTTHTVAGIFVGTVDRLVDASGGPVVCSVLQHLQREPSAPVNSRTGKD